MNCTVKKYFFLVIGIVLVSTAALFILLYSGNAFAADKIPEPKSWKFPDIIESARKISPHNVEGRLFNTFGLAYSSDELKNLPIDTMTPEELQKYADIVTHAYPDAVYRKFPASCEELPVKKLNETSVAGIAYVSLNAIDPDTREKAANCLKVIQRLLKEENSSKLSKQNAQRIRIDRVSAANHDLILGWTSPAGFKR